MSTNEPATASERLEFCRPADLPGVEIFRGERTRRLFATYHQAYAVSAVRSSSGDWLYRGRTWWLQPGHLSLMEPGEIHRNLRSYGLGAFRVVFFPHEHVIDAAAELGLPASPPRLRSPQVDDPELFDRFGRLHHALEGPATRLERQSRLSDSLELYLRRCMERRPCAPAVGVERKAVRRVVDYLRENLGVNCSLDDLRRVAGLSRFYLLRTFARRMGVPPHEYQIQLRVAEARIRIRKGHPLVQVAAELGFADQSHLTRHFKRIVGVTPARYARS